VSGERSDTALRETIERWLREHPETEAAEIGD
jgi:hypothetical protein